MQRISPSPPGSPGGEGRGGQIKTWKSFHDNWLRIFSPLPPGEGPGVREATIPDNQRTLPNRVTFQVMAPTCKVPLYCNEELNDYLAHSQELIMSRMHNPPHPGEILQDYLPESVSIAVAAQKLGVSRQARSTILNDRASISAEMAMRLSKALGTSPDMWLEMQMQYDLWQAKQRPPKGVQRLAA